MSYQDPPIIAEDETFVPLVTNILSPTTMTTTMGHRSSKGMLSIRSLGSIVAGMLLLVVAGGVVWMLPERSLDTTTTTAVKDRVEDLGVEKYEGSAQSLQGPFPTSDPDIPVWPCVAEGVSCRWIWGYDEWWLLPEFNLQKVFLGAYCDIDMN